MDLSLKHESEVQEDNQPRKVSMEMQAVAIGAVTRVLMPLELGTSGLYAGFVTSTRNGRGLLFHITSVELIARPGPSGSN